MLKLDSVNHCLCHTLGRRSTSEAIGTNEERVQQLWEIPVNPAFSELKSRLHAGIHNAHTV